MKLAPILELTDNPSFNSEGIIFFEQRNGAVLPAKAILVAAGTQPNTVLAREDSRIQLDGRYFQAVDENGEKVTPERGLAKPDTAQVLMHRAENGRFISFFGDLHPSFTTSSARDAPRY